MFNAHDLNNFAQSKYGTITINVTSGMAMIALILRLPKAYPCKDVLLCFSPLITVLLVSLLSIASAAIHIYWISPLIRKFLEKIKLDASPFMADPTITPDLKNTFNDQCNAIDNTLLSSNLKMVSNASQNIFEGLSKIQQGPMH